MNDSIKISTRHDINSILRRLSKVTMREDGRVSWKSHELDTGTFDLIYNLKFSIPIEDHVKDGAIWHVLNECARLEDFSSNFFIRRLREFLHEHEKQPLKSIVGVCQINCTSGADLAKYIKSIDGNIEFRLELSEADRSALKKENSFDSGKMGLHTEFTYAFVHVKATNDRSALAIAERNFKFGFGLLNIYHRGYGISKRFGYPNTPIGKFLTSSVTFLVNRRTRELGSYYSDCHYPSDFKGNFSICSKIDEKMTEATRHYVSGIKRIDYSEKLIQAVVLFQEGLEQITVEGALLKIWTGIELLCSREEKETTERLIQRASSIFQNPEHAAIRLRFMQEYRNKIAHQGKTGDHALLCAQWGSVFLAEIIKFCLFNKHKLYKHDDILQYMSTPIEREKLEKQMYILKKRINSLKES